MRRTVLHPQPASYREPRPKWLQAPRHPSRRLLANLVRARHGREPRPNAYLRPPVWRLQALSPMRHQSGWSRDDSAESGLLKHSYDLCRHGQMPFYALFIDRVPVTVSVGDLSLIHISEPTRLGMISYAVFCL